MIRNFAHLSTQRGRGRTLLLTAALAALIGALFAAVPPAQADPGDITWGPNLTPIFQGFCTQPTADEYVVTTGTLANTWRFQVEDESGARVDVSCPEPGLPVIVTPNGTTSPDITPLQPKLELRADNPVVTGGQSVTITAFVRNAVRRTETLGADNVAIARLHHNSGILAPTAPDADLASNDFHPDSIRIDWAYTSGELENPTIPAAATTLANNTFLLTLEVPLGTTPGEYTVSVSVTYDQYSGADYYDVSNLRTLIASTTITVSDEPFAHLAEAELALANAVTDDLSTTADETAAESGTTPAAGGDVWLRLELRDALGEPIRPDNLSRLTVFAPGAELALHGPIGDFGVPQPYLPSNPRQRFMPNQPGDALTAAGAAGTNTAALDAPNILSTMYIKASKADGQPGTVDVQAIVSSPSGVAQTETLTLNFTGPAAALELGGDLSVGQPASGGETQAETTLMATDAVGNAVMPPSTVAYVITDADGNAVSGISATNSTVGASTTTTRDDNPNAAAVLLTVSDSVDPGAYTLTASLPDIDDSATSVALKVSGPAANVMLSADQTSGTAIGDVITATATVTDADGVAVADGSEVTFTSTSASLFLFGIDANATTPGFQSRTIGGDAAARFTVVGEGTALIIASAGGQTAIVVISSDAAAEPEPTSADCLSGTSGLVSWTCSEEGSAADVFAELAEDGATALHLYNGMNWATYAIVNGRMVPGSTDFTILEGDILYIAR